MHPWLGPVLPKPIIKSTLVDQLETQPIECTALPTPEPTPPRSNSVEDINARRDQYQGKTNGMEATLALTPATTASTPSEPSEEDRILQKVDAELNESKVLGHQKFGIILAILQ